MLAWAALQMAWSDQPTLAQRFESARVTLEQMFPGRRRVGGSYQGFVKMLGRWSPRLLRLLHAHWRRALRKVAGACWTIDGWAVFAVDGTKADLPRTAALEKSFGVAGKDKSRPQSLVTCLLHLATGVTWAAHVGPATASERGHLRRLMTLLPTGSLWLADAGFTGYQLLSRLHHSGRFFVIRAASNLRLLTDLGWQIERQGQIVYLWPDSHRRAGRAPLVLRLIRLTPGRGKRVWLLTNVLDPQRLSDEQAGVFYRLRWGIEVQYRTLKQTMGRRKMLSQSPALAALELRWTLSGLWLLQLLTARSQIETGRVSPLRMSIAQAKRRLRAMLRQPSHRLRRGDNLTRRLRQAIQDTYQRRGSKNARNWPHKKTEHPPGDPRINPATPLQIKQAKAFENLKLTG